MNQAHVEKKAMRNKLHAQEKKVIEAARVYGLDEQAEKIVAARARNSYAVLTSEQKTLNDLRAQLASS